MSVLDPVLHTVSSVYERCLVYGCVWCVSVFFLLFLEGADVFVVLDFMLLPPSSPSHHIPLPPLPPRAAQARDALRQAGSVTA
jgi:hypothetical protein